MGKPEYNLIQRPDLIQRIQQFFGIRQAHVTPTLAPTVQAVAIVADLTRELQTAQASPGTPVGQVFAGGMAVVAAGAAGTFASVALQNPPGSGRILRVVSIRCTAAPVFAGIVEATSVPFLTAAGSQIPLDTQLVNRTTFIAPIVGLVRADNTDVVAPVVIAAFDQFASGNIVTYDDPIVLDESDAVQLKINTAATGLTVSFRWIEEAKVTRS